jgi:hypothetical protein
MQSGAWIALLKQIPLAQHNVLSVRTLCGTEFNVQNILRLDTDFVVIRGRLAATTETGRVYFIPYDQINYIGYTKETKVDQVRELFGEPLLGDGARKENGASLGDNADTGLQGAPPSDDMASNAEVETAASSPDKSEAPAGEATKPAERFSGKEAILQRLRARTMATMKPKTNT